jgi:hypothetical protein
VHLGALYHTRAAAAPILPDEDDEQPLDENEDRGREAEDEVVRVPGMHRIRRCRRDRGEASVPGCGGASRRKRDKHGDDDGQQLAAHPPGIL